VYYLVTTSDIKIEFNRRISNKKKCVDSILEFSINSDGDYSCLSDWKFTEYLQILKYREKCLKHLETWVVLLLHSFAVIHIKKSVLEPGSKLDRYWIDL